MAIDDNTSYELTGAQVKDLANKIKAKAADNIFVGATSAAPGSKGLVPQPQAADNEKFLSGDGTWKTVSGGGPTVVQTTGQSTTDVMSQKAVTDLVCSVISLDQGPSSSMASGTVIKSSLTQAEFNKIAAATTNGAPALFRFDDNSGDAWFYRVSAITPVDSTTVVVDVLYDGGLSWQHKSLEKLTFMAYAPGAAYPNGGIELVSGEKISDDSVYSTSEQEIGIWVDGRTVYRKVITGTTSSSNIDNVSHGITNFGDVINIYGYIHTASNGSQPIQRVVPDNITSYGIGVGNINATRVSFQHPANDYKSRPYAIVMEYVKAS